MKMKLASYIASNGLNDTTFAAKIGRTPSSVSRIRRGLVTPDPKTVFCIFRVTEGQVTPNDFYDLPAMENEFAAL